MAHCTKCGAEVPEDSYFCPACGTPVGSSVDRAAQVKDYGEEDGKVADNGLSPGFSARFDTPEYQEAMQKSNRKFALIMAAFALFTVPVIIVFMLFGKPKNPAATIGAGAFAEVIVLCVFAFVLAQRFSGKQWDGVVERKYTKRERSGRYGHRTAYIIECTTDDGKRKRHKDIVAGHPLYSDLEEGDRVRFHPRLELPLEKYDKSHDERLICHFCGTKSPFEEDYCTHCKRPLLK